MSAEERTPQEWARELGVELHGMTDEQWDAYLRYLEDEDKEKLAEVWKRLSKEDKDLHAAFAADKLNRPENQEQRVLRLRSLRELRIRRLNDIRARYGPLGDEGAEWEDEFEAIVDDPEQHPITFYSEEEADVKDEPKFREEKESNDD